MQPSIRHPLSMGKITPMLVILRLVEATEAQTLTGWRHKTGSEKFPRFLCALSIFSENPWQHQDFMSSDIG